MPNSMATLVLIVGTPNVTGIAKTFKANENEWFLCAMDLTTIFSDLHWKTLVMVVKEDFSGKIPSERRFLVQVLRIGTDLLRC